MAVTEITVSPQVLMQAGEGAPDYSAAWAIEVDRADALLAEQWAGAIFEGAPRAATWLLLTGWAVLGVTPRNSSDAPHILGWDMASASPDTLVLERRSRFLHANIVVGVTTGEVMVTTATSFANRLGRALWALIRPLHEATIAYLLPRTVARELAARS